ncbi:hypothetical protein E5288_WYG011411 [Bos mutus]|uniref:Uncharacterized protein n=1 Tax=Bos mutus TaxID=72004 RepID=A0A6B0R8M7_9CETA|nr:hypothetical protein [Bos mutus]
MKEILMTWFETQLCHLVLQTSNCKQDPEKIISVSNREIWKYVVKAFVLFVKTVIAIQAMLKTMTEAARVRE